MELLPDMNLNPMNSMCFRIVAASTCLVPKSAGLQLPGCRKSFMKPDVMWRWSHNVQVSMWRILPAPRQWPTPLAAVASPKRTGSALLPKSRLIFEIPTEIVAALTNAYHSDSPELNAIGCCVEDVNFNM
eukprot:3195287-Amphidinium_carterae.3